MRPARELVVLDKLHHNYKNFDCGQAELNAFLSGSAARHREAGISLTMVLPEVSEQSTEQFTEQSPEQASLGICAYYTLTHTEIKRENLPDTQAKKLPRYPIPVILIAQLAVASQLQGQGLGKSTLLCALEHILRINQHLPSYAVVVDALDANTQTFYEQYGFQLLYLHQGRARLFLPMGTLVQLFAAE